MARHARRLIRWLCWSIVALVVLALGALALLWAWFDPDDWRSEIETRAAAAIGRPVRLTGTLRWQPGRRIVIHSDGGEIANATGFNSGPLVRWSHLEFDVAARPLWDSRVEISSIRIDGLQLDLQRDAGGNVNWTLQRDAAATPGAREVALHIGSLQLRDAGLRYRDAAAGSDWRVSGLTASVKLPVDPGAAMLEFRDVQLGGQVAGAPLARSVPVELQAPVLRWSPQELALPAFTARWIEAAMQANIRGSVTAKVDTGPEVAVRVDVQAASLRDLLATAGIQPPAMRDDSTLGRFELHAQVRHAAGAAEVEGLQALLDDTRFDGSASLQKFAPLSLRFRLNADRINLDRYREPGKGKPLELPLAWLKQLDVQGTLRIREARIEGAVAKDVRIDVR